MADTLLSAARLLSDLLDHEFLIPKENARRLGSYIY